MHLSSLFIVMLIWAEPFSTGSASSGKMIRKPCMAGCHKMHSLIERNISALWAKVNTLSNPVHVHVHPVNIRDSSDNVDDVHHEHKMADLINKTEKLKKTGVEEMAPDTSKIEWDQKYVESKDGTNIHIHINYGESGKGNNAPQHHHHRQGKTTHDETHTLHSDPNSEYIHARCDMIPNNAVRTQHKVRGTIYLRQMPLKDLQVKVDLYGFFVKDMSSNPDSAGHLHGIHVHEYGDLSNGCNSFGGHFNPGNTAHGHHDSQHRHVGDWGNIKTDHRGVTITNFTEQLTTLIGSQSILGRGIVIHERADDEGTGPTKASQTSGDAGDGIACCVIAWYNGGIW